MEITVQGLGFRAIPKIRITRTANIRTRNIFIMEKGDIGNIMVNDN